MTTKSFQKKQKDIIENPNYTKFFSQISLFEIVIRQTVGKLPFLTASVAEIFSQGLKDNFTLLQIQNAHLASYQKVPLFDVHRDPFDRLIIATAVEENAAILTADKNFRLYSHLVDIVW